MQARGSEAEGLLVICSLTKAFDEVSCLCFAPCLLSETVCDHTDSSVQISGVLSVGAEACLMPTLYTCFFCCSLAVLLLFFCCSTHASLAAMKAESTSHTPF